ncbi:hypothetical protein [Natrarchaeobaculum aegyptiacum]|uniref:DUF8130 domain-containing protein n=1 Tax=Natrarchaeobaculum aegyptiacum TaxID=745377 RepID=A0A2Z2HZ03_9EURY|nr:hypothetical protein [Natrarchaeobaculum aegyptiacum]ARS91117.1 hypothetical protein B1756_16185 [Natrarchaeobaculum aegyptiacum]
MEPNENDHPSGRRPTLRRRTMLGAVVGSTTLLAGCLGDTEFSITGVRDPDDVRGPPSFDLDVLDPDILVDSPGAFELSVTNDSDEPIELVSLGVRPFGVLELHGTSGYGRSRVRLYSEAYEESDHLDFRRDGMSFSRPELVRKLEPAETTSRTFQIWGEWVPNSDGTYALTGRGGDEPVVRYRRPDDASGESATDGGNAGSETGDESASTGVADGGEHGDENDDGGLLAGTAIDPDVEFRIETRSRLPFR